MKPEKIHCHVETAVAVIGGKWKPWILWHLYDGIRRYGELRRLTPGITGKMLTQHLRELERDGIIKRTAHAEAVLRVEYSFTKYGETLRPLLRDLCAWGDKHGRRVRSLRPQPTSAATPSPSHADVPPGKIITKNETGVSPQKPKRPEPRPPQARPHGSAG